MVEAAAAAAKDLSIIELRRRLSLTFVALAMVLLGGRSSAPEELRGPARLGRCWRLCTANTLLAEACLVSPATASRGAALCSAAFLANFPALACFKLGWRVGLAALGWNTAGVRC